VVNSREDFHLQDLAHAGRTNRPLAVATLSIPALKDEGFREFSINCFWERMVLVTGYGDFLLRDLAIGLILGWQRAIRLLLRHHRQITFLRLA
jgi:hypothetical protein